MDFSLFRNGCQECHCKAARLVKTVPCVTDVRNQHVLVTSQPDSSATSRMTNTDYFLIALHIILSSKLKLICTAFLLIELQPQCHLNCSSTWHSLGTAQTEGERAWSQTEAALWSVLNSTAMRSAQLHFGIYLTNKKFVSVFISQDINVSFVVEEILLPGSDPNLIWHAVFVTVL